MDEPQVIKARFAQVNIVIADGERSMAFYRILGVDQADMPEPRGDHNRTVSNVNPEVTVEFDRAASATNWASVWDQSRIGAVIGFVVEHGDDVDVLVDVLTATRHRVLQPARDAFFGARHAVVEDPDGIPVGIMGPIGDARRWMPELPG